MSRRSFAVGLISLSPRSSAHQDSISKAQLQEIFTGLCERFGVDSMATLHMHLLAYVMRPRPALCRKIRSVAEVSLDWTSGGASSSASSRTGDIGDAGNGNEQNTGNSGSSSAGGSTGSTGSNRTSSTERWSFSADVSVHVRAADKHDLDAELLAKFTSSLDHLFAGGGGSGGGGSVASGSVHGRRTSRRESFSGKALFSSDDLGAIDAFRQVYGPHGATFQQVHPGFFMQVGRFKKVFCHQQESARSLTAGGASH